MEINYGAGFKKQLKRLAKQYRHIKHDIEPVITALEDGELPGDQLTGYEYTLYKVRAQNIDSQKGKSGGYRVIYYLKTAANCSLVTIYSKSDQGDIDKNVLLSLLDEFR